MIDADRIAESIAVDWINAGFRWTPGTHHRDAEYNPTKADRAYARTCGASTPAHFAEIDRRVLLYLWDYALVDGEES